MRNYKSILVYGFALFAMFFGSGNLVFPIKIGQITGSYWLLGFLGLFITGIFLPFLGLFVIKLHKGNYNAFFAEAGSIAKVALPLFTLSLLGSFGVVPRCVTVAYGGIAYIIPQISLELFSPIFCIITFFFCLKDQRMINILGKWMSPILLVALTVLIIAGVTNNQSTQLEYIKPTEAFYNGFLIGYQTMDLFAAFFFSALIFIQIQNMLPPDTSHKETIKFAVKSSIISAGLLSLVYFGFVFLGAHFSNITANVEPEFMLATIAKHILGNNATVFIGIAMLFSCFTTAVALNNIYARYLCSLFNLKNDKFTVVLIITTAISYLISLFDFKGIAAFLAPALEISYPSIILLTILSIFSNKWHKLKICTFYGVLIMMIGLDLSL